MILLFEPSLLATILLVVFVVSLVAVIRERPSLKHFGPLLLVWGLAMLMLIFIRDLGSSLMFFGGFLALLYVATARLSLVGVGAAMFLGGAAFFANNVAHVHDRVEIWLDTFSQELQDRQVRVERQGYQIAQSLFAQADGGLFGRASARRCSSSPGGPAPAGAAHRPDLRGDRERGSACSARGLLVAYLLFAAAASRRRWSASDGFSKLLATGLTAVFALQVFVIVGGVTRVIPLTGVTLPFVSYGGSSIVANFVLLALLLIVSDRARAERLGAEGWSVNRQIAQPLRPGRRPVRAARRPSRPGGRCSTPTGLKDNAAQPPAAARAAAASRAG